MKYKPGDIIKLPSEKVLIDQGISYKISQICANKMVKIVRLSENGIIFRDEQTGEWWVSLKDIPKQTITDWKAEMER